MAKPAGYFKRGSEHGWLYASQIYYPKEYIILSVIEAIFCIYIYIYIYIYTIGYRGAHSWKELIIYAHVAFGSSPLEYSSVRMTISVLALQCDIPSEQIVLDVIYYRTLLHQRHHLMKSLLAAQIIFFSFSFSFSLFFFLFFFFHHGYVTLSILSLPSEVLQFSFVFVFLSQCSMLESLVTNNT